MHSGYSTVVEPYQRLCYGSNILKLLLAGWFDFQPERYHFLLPNGPWFKNFSGKRWSHDNKFVMMMHAISPSLVERVCNFFRTLSTHCAIVLHLSGFCWYLIQVLVFIIQESYQGPSIYYVIKILVFLEPIHQPCNQTLLINQTNFTL